MREFLVNRPDAAAMERILENHISDAVGVVLRLAWQAGLLRDEITNLTWDQVDFERGQIQLPARVFVGGEQRRPHQHMVLRAVHMAEGQVHHPADDRYGVC